MISLRTCIGRGLSRHAGSLRSTSQPSVASRFTDLSHYTFSPQQQQQQQQRKNVHIERKLEELGIELPSPPPPRANYNIVCYAPGLNYEKEMMYVSGHLPILNDGTLLTGPVGIGPDDKKESSPENGKTIEEGQLAARHAVLNLVSTMKDQLGDLDRVVQVVKVFGIVNSKTDFKHQHLVMDGCSDTFMEIFGKPVGYHARSAIGVNTLPLDITVEVEAIVQIKPE